MVEAWRVQQLAHAPLGPSGPTGYRWCAKKTPPARYRWSTQEALWDRAMVDHIGHAATIECRDEIFFTDSKKPALSWRMGFRRSGVTLPRRGLIRRQYGDSLARVRYDLGDHMNDSARRR